MILLFHGWLSNETRSERSPTAAVAGTAGQSGVEEEKKKPRFSSHSRVNGRDDRRVRGRVQIVLRGQGWESIYFLPFVPPLSSIFRPCSALLFFLIRPPFFSLVLSPCHSFSLFQTLPDVSRWSDELIVRREKSLGNLGLQWRIVLLLAWRSRMVPTRRVPLLELNKKRPSSSYRRLSASSAESFSQREN